MGLLLLLKSQTNRFPVYYSMMFIKASKYTEIVSDSRFKQVLEYLLKDINDESLQLSSAYLLVAVKQQ